MSGIDPSQFQEVYNLVISTESANILGKAIKEDALKNSLITIASGVFVFVLGQIFQNFILKPIQDFFTVKGEICHKVKWHINVLTNSGLKEELINRSSGDMRDLSCQLETKYILIPFKMFFSTFRLIPNKEKMKEAASILILLSNAGGKPGYEIRNSDKIDKLKEILKINI